MTKDYYLNLARDIKSLNESVNTENIKKANDNGNKLLRSLNNIDFTTDSAVEGIYYALSSFLGISIISSKLPLVPKVISNATNKHLNTKVLPKYRNRLLNVYKGRIEQISNSIENLKLKMDDDNKADIEQELENLITTKEQLERDCDRIRLVK